MGNQRRVAQVREHNDAWQAVPKTPSIPKAAELRALPNGWRPTAVSVATCIESRKPRQTDGDMGKRRSVPMGTKPPGEFKLNWQPSELPGEEFADIRGRGRFSIRTTDKGNVVLRHNGAVVGYFSLAESAKAEAQKRVPGILRGE